MSKISIKGNASGKLYGPWELSSVSDSMSLMNFLISKGIPIASSCDGEGQCQKCITSQGVMTCQVTPSQFIKSNLQVVEINYL